MSAFHPNQLGKGDQTRLRDYVNNLAFYNGKQWPGRRTNDKSRQLTLNYARTMVDKITAYVMSGVRYNVTGPDETAARAAEAALLEAHAANALDRLDYDTETDTAVLGDGAFRVSWSEPGAARRHHRSRRPRHLHLAQGPQLTDYDQVAHRYTLPADQASASPPPRRQPPSSSAGPTPSSRSGSKNTIVQAAANLYGLIHTSSSPTTPSLNSSGACPTSWPYASPPPK
jgi:hypothetical protein